MRLENQLSPCEAFDGDLKAYLDGELPLLRRLQVRAHLARCPQCAEELKIMQTIEKELKSEVMAPLQSDLRAKILQGAPNEVTTDELPTTKQKRNYRVALEYGFALSTVCLVIVMLMSITGKRISNSFNAAQNALTTGEEIPSYQSAATEAPPFLPPVLGTFPGGASAPAAGTNEAVRRGDLWKTSNRDFSTPKQRSVHKEGSLTVAVDDAEAKGSAIETMVKNVGGFVANNALSTGPSGLKSATLDVRIPVDKFEQIVQKIGALGTVRTKSINGEDVTTRVAVAVARRETLGHELAVAQAQLKKLSLSFKPDSPEIFRARAEVRSLNLQAAQARAEQETLRRFAALSTLYVTLQDKSKAVAPASFSSSLGETGRDAWNSFLNSARLPIQLLIWILAYSPLWIPALIVWRKFGRKLLA